MPIFKYFMSCSWEIAQILQLIENLVVCRKAGCAVTPYSVVYLCGGLGGGYTLLTLLQRGKAGCWPAGELLTPPDPTKQEHSVALAVQIRGSTPVTRTNIYQCCNQLGISES